MVEWYARWPADRVIEPRRTLTVCGCTSDGKEDKDVVGRHGAVSGYALCICHHIAEILLSATLSSNQTKNHHIHDLFLGIFPYNHMVTK